MIFSVDDESEEKREFVSVTSLRYRNQHNKGHAISAGAEVSEKPAIAEESAEPMAMEETER